VVKELLENALDAGASRIEVRVEQGGKKLISVRDNGCGMSAGDVVVALRRHATSKISVASDLDTITTMGFRGEALPSVAAVSRFEILTRLRDDSVGTKVSVAGGRDPATAEVGAPEGTIVQVRDLFYNVPARRRFLLSAQAETRHCTEVVTRVALVHPAVALTYFVDGRRRLHYPATETLGERIQAVVGKELAAGMVSIEYEEFGFRIRGMAGTPQTYRASRTQQILFVNRRPIQDRGLAGAIYALYRDHLKAGQYPVYVLMIEVDPARVDVNIHPSKAEIRFRESKEAVRALRHALAEMLRSEGVTPSWRPLSIVRGGAGTTGMRPAATAAESPVAAGSDAAAEPPRQAELAWADGREGEVETDPGGIAERAGALRAALAARVGEHPAAESAKGLIPASAEMPPLGMPSCWQFARTYIFTPLKGDLLMVDQHTAHERVLFEATMASILAGAVPAQRLLFPVELDLDPAEEEVLQSQAEAIASVGYEVERLAPQRIALVAVPAVGRDARAGQIFHHLLGELAETSDGRLLGIERVAATFACKAAVKAGDPLNEEEMAQLVNQVFATKQPFYCPHGRPTVVRIGLLEIERRFGRI
jgi:DNA mismatch repair protein MutL